MSDHKTVFSPCRAYRYTLWREWDAGLEYAMFIGLNPSTADEVSDDPTVRRCIGFSKRWGYGALCMTNIFAFRSTDPVAMTQSYQPIGVLNDDHLLSISEGAGIVVAAWGEHGGHMDRDKAVLAMLFGHGRKLHHLGVNKSGRPKHPLYLRASTAPMEFNRNRDFKHGGKTF